MSMLLGTMIVVSVMVMAVMMMGMFVIVIVMFMAMIIMMMVVAMIVIMVVVSMIVVVMMVTVVVGLDRAGFLPDGKRPHGHQDEHRDSANQHGNVEGIGEHDTELAALVHQDGDAAEQADHEDREQLLDEIIARRLAVMMVIVRHDCLRKSVGEGSASPRG